MDDFADLTAAIHVWSDTLVYLGGDLAAVPNFLPWMDRRERYALSFEQYQDLACDLREACRNQYRENRRRKREAICTQQQASG